MSKAALPARMHRARDDGSMPILLARTIAHHKIVRLVCIALLALVNCVCISYCANAGSDANVLCFVAELVFGAILIAFIGLDDVYVSQPRMDKVVDYWQRIATRDSLTGLHNRLAFLQALDYRIAIAGETRSRYGVMFIDLNKFKPINDTFGHAIGDGVLTISARRLLQAAGSDDIVARLGGDEFAILLMRTNVMLARKLEVDISNAFKVPMNINGHTLYISASVGTCLGSDHHRHAEDVIHNADVLMYRQKALSRWNGNTRITESKVQGVKRSGKPRP